ncbi:hypothetical protein BCR35DRAFT_32364 [Leucosporidium creatinivorum]|uniref:Uncharacterized protein n=1 Tax=Leucosporidium creatinivorum TaxID=106004 RepID=A0A1Y2FVV2_9BASI|nr:hypothetical protein BCR35DRAFT_32364 [Leucosporidium creatinivorum]
MARSISLAKDPRGRSLSRSPCGGSRKDLSRRFRACGPATSRGRRVTRSGRSRFIGRGKGSRSCSMDGWNVLRTAGRRLHGTLMRKPHGSKHLTLPPRNKHYRISQRVFSTLQCARHALGEATRHGNRQTRPRRKAAELAGRRDRSLLRFLSPTYPSHLVSMPVSHRLLACSPDPRRPHPRFHPLGQPRPKRRGIPPPRPCLFLPPQL